MRLDVFGVMLKSIEKINTSGEFSGPTDGFIRNG